MIDVKREYGTQEQDLAAFMAFLTNSSLKHSNGKITLASDHNLKEHIDQLLNEKKFIEASELIKSAKSLQTESAIDAKIISKSYRMPFNRYYQIMSAAVINDESMSDVFKKILLPSISSTLDELQSHPIVEKDKIKLLRTLFLDWTNIKTPIRKLNTLYVLSKSGYYMDKNLVLRYLQELILKRCSDSGTDDEYTKNIIDTFMHLLKTSSLGDHYVNCIFNFELDNITCRICNEFEYWLMEDPCSVEDFRNILDNDPASKSNTDEDSFYSYEDAITEFFNEITKVNPQTDETDDRLLLKSLRKFESIVIDLIGDFRMGIPRLSLGNYNITFKDNSLLFGGVEVQNVDAVRAIIYKTLVSESELLPLSFDANERLELLRKALSEDDYENASKYSQELERHQIIDNLALDLAEMLKIKANDSEVITISMPKAVSLIIDLAKDKKSNKAFISEICQNYFENTSE